uniref:Uncharacterized protein n=1 Tax=Anguilla anguilla TaxID=7936 RepID=A0A0E9XFV2_ANGAN
MVRSLCPDPYPLPQTIIGKSFIHKQLPSGVNQAQASNH